MYLSLLHILIDRPQTLGRPFIASRVAAGTVPGCAGAGNTLHAGSADTCMLPWMVCKQRKEESEPSRRAVTEHHFCARENRCFSAR
jgi:hypothetical protein